MTAESTSTAIKVAVITVSDRCFQATALDTSGTNLVELINAGTSLSNARVVHYKVIPDERDVITEELKNICDTKGADVLFTTGGTGFTPRDVTPEATRDVIERRASAMEAAILMKSMQITPLAMLSRGICGIRKRTLICNFPGSKKAAVECLSFIGVAIPHAVHQLRGDADRVKAVHDVMQTSVVDEISKPETDQKSPEVGDVMQEPCGGKDNHNFCNKDPHLTKQSTLSLLAPAKRNRHSQYPMTSMVDAAKAVIHEMQGYQLKKIMIDLSSAVGHVLFEDIKAVNPFPPFRASVKDGYAVISSQGAGHARVLKAITAGDTAEVLIESEQRVCVRVSTGAPVPEPFDAVVQVEHTVLVETTQDGFEEVIVNILKPATIAQDIRPIGCDIPAGTLVLEAGQTLRPTDIGLLASLGFSQVAIAAPPVVGVMSTGNELCDVSTDDRQMAPGVSRIFDSNRPLLMALLTSHIKFGCCGAHGEVSPRCIDLGIAPDRENELRNHFEQALSRCEIVVTTGGVSMGEKDLIKPVLTGSPFNGTVVFGRICMKPGKPTTFIKITDYPLKGDKRWVFALPGNPVSAAVTCHLFLITALKATLGAECLPNGVNVTLTHNYRLDPRPEYTRAFVDLNKMEATVASGNQASSRLLSFAKCNALLTLPGSTPDRTLLTAGSVVKALLIDPL